MSSFVDIPGAVCAATGFRAAGVAAGLKRSGGLDLALIVSDALASASLRPRAPVTALAQPAFTTITCGVAARLQMGSKLVRGS